MRILAGRFVSGVLVIAILVALAAVLFIGQGLSSAQHAIVLYGVLVPVLVVAAPLAGLNLGFWLERRSTVTRRVNLPA